MRDPVSKASQTESAEELHVVIFGLHMHEHIFIHHMHGSSLSPPPLTHTHTLDVVVHAYNPSIWQGLSGGPVWTTQDCVSTTQKAVTIQKP